MGLGSLWKWLLNKLPQKATQRATPDYVKELMSVVGARGEASGGTDLPRWMHPGGNVTLDTLQPFHNDVFDLQEIGELYSLMGGSNRTNAIGSKVPPVMDRDELAKYLMRNTAQ